MNDIERLDQAISRLDMRTKELEQVLSADISVLQARCRELEERLNRADAHTPPCERRY